MKILHHQYEHVKIFIETFTFIVDIWYILCNMSNIRYSYPIWILGKLLQKYLTNINKKPYDLFKFCIKLDLIPFLQVAKYLRDFITISLKDVFQWWSLVFKHFKFAFDDLYLDRWIWDQIFIVLDHRHRIEILCSNAILSFRWHLKLSCTNSCYTHFIHF